MPVTRLLKKLPFIMLGDTSENCAHSSEADEVCSSTKDSKAALTVNQTVNCYKAITVTLLITALAKHLRTRWQRYYHPKKRPHSNRKNTTTAAQSSTKKTRQGDATSEPLSRSDITAPMRQQEKRTDTDTRLADTAALLNSPDSSAETVYRTSTYTSEPVGEGKDKKQTTTSQYCKAKPRLKTEESSIGNHDDYSDGHSNDHVKTTQHPHILPSAHRAAKTTPAPENSESLELLHRLQGIPALALQVAKSNIADGGLGVFAAQSTGETLDPKAIYSLGVYTGETIGQNLGEGQIIQPTLYQEERRLNIGEIDISHNDHAVKINQQGYELAGIANRGLFLASAHLVSIIGANQKVYPVLFGAGSQIENNEITLSYGKHFITPHLPPWRLLSGDQPSCSEINTINKIFNPICCYSPPQLKVKLAEIKQLLTSAAADIQGPIIYNDSALVEKIKQRTQFQIWSQLSGAIFSHPLFYEWLLHQYPKASKLINELHQLNRANMLDKMQYSASLQQEYHHIQQDALHLEHLLQRQPQLQGQIQQLNWHAIYQAINDHGWIFCPERFNPLLSQDREILQRLDTQRATIFNLLPYHNDIAALFYLFFATWVQQTYEDAQAAYQDIPRAIMPFYSPNYYNLLSKINDYYHKLLRPQDSPPLQIGHLPLKLKNLPAFMQHHKSPQEWVAHSYQAIQQVLENMQTLFTAAHPGIEKFYHCLQQTISNALISSGSVLSQTALLTVRQDHEQKHPLFIQWQNALPTPHEALLPQKDHPFQPISGYYAQIFTRIVQPKHNPYHQALTLSAALASHSNTQLHATINEFYKQAALLLGKSYPHKWQYHHNNTHTAILSSPTIKPTQSATYQQKMQKYNESTNTALRFSCSLDPQTKCYQVQATGLHQLLNKVDQMNTSAPKQWREYHQNKIWTIDQ